MAISMAAGKASIKKFKADPLRVKLLKPAVMLAVNICMIVIIDHVFTKHIIEQYKIVTSAGYVPSPDYPGQGEWYSLFAVFSYLTIMPACVYLAGEVQHVKGKNLGNGLKVFGTVSILVASVGTLITCFLFRDDTTSLYVEIHRPLVIVAAIVVPMTMLVMEAVERRLLKTIESRRAGAVEMDERIRLQIEKEMQGTK